MKPNTPITLLQLISVFTFTFLHLLPPLFSIGLVVRDGCQDWCGNISIPYPFGVGLDCSFEPSFNITCNTSSDPPKAYLSFIDKEVIEINQTYVRVRYPNMISACYDSSDNQHGMGVNVTAEQDKNSMSVNLSGTPYTLSEWNRLIAIGCDDVLLQSNGSSVSGGCSAFCAEKNDTGGVGYCPNNATSLGNGCCQAYISGAMDLLGAKLIDSSGKLGRRKLFQCSLAFIHEMMRNVNETIISYPLYYLDNSTALQSFSWASTTRPPVVQLDWKIGAENCSQARVNTNRYACRHDKTVCVDYGGRGYRCSCMEGYEGNPYVHDGCKALMASTRSIAKPGCPEQCGKSSIPFPFGVGRNCFLAPSFEIICNTSTNPPKPYLHVLNAEITQMIMNSSQFLVNYPNQLGLACYNLSNHEISKINERSLIIDLSTTQYTLSNENWITAVGCDDMVVGVIGQGTRTSIGSGCASVCWDRQILANAYGYCPMSSTTTYYPADGCCRAPIPRGTTYLEANLTDLSGRWPRTNFSCGYAFIQYKDEQSYDIIYPILNNSTGITFDDQLSVGDWRLNTTLALDWRIGTVNCKEAQQDGANYACQANTECVDFDVKVGGYLCNCSKGYEGNPYLIPGCQDINECADHTTNPCVSNSSCNNNIGSFQCLCQIGYIGDGRKDGSGCIQLPPSKSKMMIWIGMASGLGLILLLLMCFWLYKMLQKREAKKLKEKFFKRNGGLLLRHQTNEGALGKTKIFLADELEVATDNFNANRILGQGGQGTVFKGMLSNGKIVAIKKSKVIAENQLEQFINEVVILSQINHRNIVKLLGCCLETEVPLLVYEFMPNGTLFDLIHDPNNEFPFQWSMRLKIAGDIATALAYLHSASSMPIYHRDIKSSNILLDEKYVVKVSDFGTSRSVAIDQTHLTTLVKGTFGYLDPEYFQSSQFTEKSDVYSFGVVLVELLTGQRPISLDIKDEERGLATRFLTSIEKNCLDTILDPQVSDQGKNEEVILVATLAQRCLNLKGKMRPSMRELAAELETIRISQTSADVKEEFEEVTDFEDLPTMISDIGYTWTTSYKSGTTLSSDTHPLMFAAE